LVDVWFGVRLNQGATAKDTSQQHVIGRSDITHGQPLDRLKFGTNSFLHRESKKKI
jgi:hypothetical protein